MRLLRLVSFRISLLFLVFLSASAVHADDCDAFPAGDLAGDDLLVTLSKLPGHQLRRDWKPADLVSIPTLKGQLKMQLRREAAMAFAAMEAAAAKQNIELKIRSAYRSYARQCTLYKIALNKRDGINFTAHPGRSEHQLGTTVDIGTLSFDYQKTPAFHWLMLNAHHFGYTMSYGDSDHSHDEAMNPETGYAYEPWHWRYVGTEAASRRWASSISLLYFLLVRKNTAQPLDISIKQDL